MSKVEIFDFNAPPSPPIGYKELEEKRLAGDAVFPHTMGLRMRRVVSWINRAEQLSKGDDADLDMQFIALWIGFNAICANSEYVKDDHELPESESRQTFFKKVIFEGKDSVLKKAIRKKLGNFINKIVVNEFLYHKYWERKHGDKRASNWKTIFRKDIVSFEEACKEQKYEVILEKLFKRLYVMRNQLMHGGATWKSSVNREQLEDCVVVLGYLLPLFVDIMMSHPKSGWGIPFYPVVPKKSKV